MTATKQRIKPVHDVAYIHMPVPKARLDEAYYYKPMANLDLHDTKLFLGVVPCLNGKEREGTGGINFFVFVIVLWVEL